ncbi:MAG: endonuclease III [Phycisphaerales bacterium]|nr:MAG: endonuclease III [Phycisphaerales bacterium]
MSKKPAPRSLAPTSPKQASSKKLSSKKPGSKTTSPKTVQKTPARPAANPRGLGDIPFPLPQVEASEKRRARRLLAMLDEHYPDAICELDYTTPHELLVATILSAQATDVGVNKATPALFARFPTPGDYAVATPEEIEPYIRTIGLFRNKAKAIHAAMTEVVTRFGGQVPRTMDELLTLRGVARKTANVVLGNAYGVHVGFVVDTHIERLSKRFALCEAGDTVQAVERRLMALFPRDRWTDASHMIIWHGRRACTARGNGPCSDHPICKRFGARCDRARS